MALEQTTTGGITVKSGINRVTLGYEEGVTVSDLYNKCSQVLNLDGSSNMNVVVDGEQYEFDSIRTDRVTNNSVVEFIKRAGSKGY